MKKTKIKKITKKEKVDRLLFHNAHVVYLNRWLDTPLHGKQSRARNRIYRIVKAIAEEVEEERQKLIEKHAKKENGKRVMEGNKFVMKNQEKFQKEWDALLAEERVLDILPSNENDWKVVREIMDEHPAAFGAEEGMYYDEIMNELEKI